MHEVLVNRLGVLSLPRKSVVRLTDRSDMTLDVYRARKTTMQQQQQGKLRLSASISCRVLIVVNPLANLHTAEMMHNQCVTIKPPKRHFFSDR